MLPLVSAGRSNCDLFFLKLPTAAAAAAMSLEYFQRFLSQRLDFSGLASSNFSEAHPASYNSGIKPFNSKFPLLNTDQNCLEAFQFPITVILDELD